MVSVIIPKNKDMKYFKVTHKTKEGKIIVEHEETLKWVNTIVSAVMKDDGEILGITKSNEKGFE